MTVNPAHFVKAMRDRWAQEYGLVSHEPLEQAWHEMAVTFNDHIEGKVPDEWSVLRLPTGSGKTQGLALYCSLLSKEKNHPGVLVITKFTDEVDALVSIINQEPYTKTALAEHSKLKKRLTPKEMHSVPVLAITHSMYKQTLDAASQGSITKPQWERFTEWEYGPRKLIVIDESLDVIEPVHISHDLLRMVRGWIPRHMEINHPEQIEAFEKIIFQFYEWEKVHLKKYDKEEVAVDHWAEISQASISVLSDELCKLPLGQMITGREDRGNMIRRCRDIFSDILYLLSNQSWYERGKEVGALYSAYVALPTHINNVVIMDATARQSRVYELLGSIPRYPQIPDNVRNYKNVRLHVLYGYQNSTSYLMKPEQDEQHFVDVVDALEPHIPFNKKFLFVTSKEVSKKLSKVKDKYTKCSVAYWGDINGKNIWSDCSAIVIYGLPRLNDITIKNSVLAFENWHIKTKSRYAVPDILEEHPDGTSSIYIQDNFVEEPDYYKGYAATEVIQAINRVRCRKIVDSEGGCQETDVYILFNKGDDFERSILDAIIEEMKGIQVVLCHTPTVQKKRVRSKLGQEIIRLLEKLPAGNYPAIDLLENIQAKGMGSTTALSTFIADCKKKDSPEEKALADIGYQYNSDIKGGRSNKGAFKYVGVRNERKEHE